MLRTDTYFFKSLLCFIILLGFVGAVVRDCTEIRPV